MCWKVSNASIFYLQLCKKNDYFAKTKTNEHLLKGDKTSVLTMVFLIS